MNQIAVAASPHRRSKNSTTRIMLDVLIALAPAFVAANLIFGFRAAVVTAVCVGSCVLLEYLSRRIMKRPNTISDLSAAVTGVLLAYNLPVTIPLWMAVIGSFFAIVVVKQCFGGIGQNFTNPAITARVILLVSFTGQMTHWVEPFFYQKGVDAIAGATPLVMASSQPENLPSLLQMFLGVRPGCLGETSVLALLIGGIYLIVRRVIHPAIPAVYLGTVFCFSVIFGMDPLYQLMSGGLVLGAFFMATDYSTSPITPLGKVVFALGCGTLTILIRRFGSYPEGVSFAILFMNLLVPYLDKGTKLKPFGGKKMRTVTPRDIIKPAVTLALIALVVSAALVFTYNLTNKDTGGYSAEVNQSVEELLGSGYRELDLTQHQTEMEENKTAGAFVNASGTMMALYVTPAGYGGPIDLVVSVDGTSGTIAGIRVASHSETPDLGARIVEPEFQDQFIGKSGTFGVAAAASQKGENDIDALAGATVSSKGFTDGVNKALASFAILKGEMA